MPNLNKNYKVSLYYTLALVILISLGTWQLYRLKWKLNLIDILNNRINLETISLSNLQDLNIETDEYKKIKVKGHFLNSKEIHLYGGSRVYKGEAGYFILTPFETLNKQHILINRGWVPEKKKNASDRVETIIDHEIEVEGSILKGERKTLFVPDNNIKNNVWLWIDLNGIKKQTDLKLVDFFILQKENEDKNILPIGKNLTLNVKNDHLGYAIIWYMLACILTIIFYIYMKQNTKNNSK